jgi:hypothetical protein
MRVLKKFITFSEAAAELDTDRDGLRQGIETGVAIGLPAFVYCGDRPFLARLTGKIAGAEYDDETETATITLRNGTKIRDAFFAEGSDISDMDLGDSLGDVHFADISPSESGYPGAFELRGFFRVAQYHMKRAAREGHLGMVDVAPASWWEGGAPPLLEMEIGNPTYFFTLKPTNISKFRDLPDLVDVYFRVSDVHALSARLKQPPKESKTQLDTRERTTLLTIIGALAEAANLDLSKHNKAGETVALMLAAKGVTLAGRTIGEHLKAVPEAMESRKEK